MSEIDDIRRLHDARVLDEPTRTVLAAAGLTGTDAETSYAAMVRNGGIDAPLEQLGMDGYRPALILRQAREGATT